MFAIFYLYTVLIIFVLLISIGRKSPNKLSYTSATIMAFFYPISIPVIFIHAAIDVLKEDTDEDKEN